MNDCMWCWDPAVAGDKFCVKCGPIARHPLTHCQTNPAHLPTHGPECASCALERQRAEIRRRQNAPRIAQLERIRERLIKDWNRPWPGMNFCKGIAGKALDRAIKELS